MSQLQQLAAGLPLLGTGPASSGWMLVSEVVYRHWYKNGDAHVLHDCRFCYWMITGKQFWAKEPLVVQVMPGRVKTQTGEDLSLIPIFDGSRTLGVTSWQLKPLDDSDL